MSEKNTCVSCGSDSTERLLIKCEKEGQDVHVCARCLPMFIHGGAH